MSARSSSGSWSGGGGAPPDIIDLDRFMRGAVRPSRPDARPMRCDQLVVDAGGVNRKPGAATVPTGPLASTAPAPPLLTVASSSSCSRPPRHAKRFSHDSGLSDGSYARRKHRPHRRAAGGDNNGVRALRTPAGSSNSLRAFRAVCERALLDQQAQIARVAQLCERLTERVPRRRSERSLSPDTSDVSSSSRSTRDQRRKDKHRTEECKTYKIIMNKLDELNHLFAARARSPAQRPPRHPAPLRRGSPSSGSVSVSDKLVATEPEHRTQVQLNHNIVTVRGGGESVGGRGSAGGAGSTRMSGAPGSTRVSGAPGSTRMSGAPGSTRVSGPPGSTRMSGPPGSTRVSGPPGSTRMSGPPGSTRISGPPGSARVSGPPGSMRVSGPPGSTRVSGPLGSTRVSVPPGSTRVSVPPGSTRVSGPPGSTRVSGPPGSTRVSGPPGSTRLSEAPGSTRMAAAPGSTRMAAAACSSRLAGLRAVANTCALDIPPCDALPTLPHRHNIGNESVVECDSRAGTMSSVGDPRCGFDLEDPVHRRARSVDPTERRYDERLDRYERYERHNERHSERHNERHSERHNERRHARPGKERAPRDASLCQLCRSYWRALRHYVAAQIFCCPDNTCH